MTRTRLVIRWKNILPIFILTNLSIGYIHDSCRLLRVSQSVCYYGRYRAVCSHMRQLVRRVWRAGRHSLPSARYRGSNCRGIINRGNSNSNSRGQFLATKKLREGEVPPGSVRYTRKIRGFDESKPIPNKLTPFVPSFDRYPGI
jgi:hypothetical protein